jgi:hypothetical protein
MEERELEERIDEDELEQQEAEELPPREQMSVISLDTMDPPPIIE